MHRTEALAQHIIRHIANTAIRGRIDLPGQRAIKESFAAAINKRAARLVEAKRAEVAATLLHKRPRGIIGTSVQQTTNRELRRFKLPDAVGESLADFASFVGGAIAHKAATEVGKAVGISGNTITGAAKAFSKATSKLKAPKSTTKLKRNRKKFGRKIVGNAMRVQASDLMTSKATKGEPH